HGPQRISRLPFQHRKCYARDRFRGAGVAKEAPAMVKASVNAKRGHGGAPKHQVARTNMTTESPPSTQPKPAGLIAPCMPTEASKPPVGPRWVHEIKHDGFRMIARRQGERVRLFSGAGDDWSLRYPRIVRALSALKGVTSLTIDGEAVVADGRGIAVLEL